MKTVIQFLMILIGALLIADSLFIAPRVNFNAGVIMPAILGLPLLIWGVFYRPLLIFSERGFFLGLKWLIIVGYLLFILSFAVVMALIVRAEKEPIPKDVDAVVVLGAALRGSVVTHTLAMRLNVAADILKTDPGLLVVVSGGQGPGEDLPEGVAMAQYLIDQQIDASRILIEDHATSTFENLTLAKSLLQSIGRDPLRIVVVTSNYHVFRAVLAARNLGYIATGAGAPTIWDLLPNNLLREYLAIIKYAILGY
jgi:uncharacterized SAM-binding protein YcdF (DUF218 family)